MLSSNFESDKNVAGRSCSSKNAHLNLPANSSDVSHSFSSSSVGISVKTGSKKDKKKVTMAKNLLDGDLSDLDDDGDKFRSEESEIFSLDFTALACLADIVTMYQDDSEKALDPIMKPRILNRCSRGHGLANPEVISRGKVILMNRLRKNEKD